MDVFDYRDHIIDDYRRFTTSFTKIKAPDIQAYVKDRYDSEYYWPAPLVQINPVYTSGKNVEQLVADGILHPTCEQIFRFGRTDDQPGEVAKLYKHQEEAIQLAQNGESYVLTIGTGSGKSMSYMLPIIDYILKTKRPNDPPSIKAIIIYPMNALVNSQREELDRFLGHYGNAKPITYSRYTAQEDDPARQVIAEAPPDIILTNFMMLEYLMTRHGEYDQHFRRAARGLQFLVLDELHTYRGRQGADVAMLVRRIREALNLDVQCIGTSATMASEGSRQEKNEAVADVASKLFGVRVKPESIITETLQRQTTPAEKPTGPTLAKSIQSGLPPQDDFKALREHPLSAWIELTLGMTKEEGRLVRAKPQTIKEAVDALAKDSDLTATECATYLRQFLLQAYQCRDTSDKPLFAFRLHQFIAGANLLFSTLEPAGQRWFDLSGQQFLPGDRDKKFFHVHFCRQCGQDYHPVFLQSNPGEQQLVPRGIDDHPHDDDTADFGVFMFDVAHEWDDSDLDNYPENWLERRQDTYRIKNSFKPYRPQGMYVEPHGRISQTGKYGWFIPGSFRFCLSCDAAYAARGRDANRLTSLSSEGRSSATTVLTISALRYMLEQDTGLESEAQKLLGFTDNRQDAALQAGYFNDFVQILLLRGALLAAVQQAPAGYLTDSDIAQQVFRQLSFDQTGEEYLENPQIKGPNRRRAEEAMRNVLGYRLYFDLRRGWRYNNPNLEQLGLLTIDYDGLQELCEDHEEWQHLPFSQLAQTSPTSRERALRLVLDTMRRGLCIKSRSLDRLNQEQMRNQSYQFLNKDRWGLAEDEHLQEACVLTPDSLSRHPGQAIRLITASSRSALGQRLKRESTWEEDYVIIGRITDANYPDLINSLLQVLYANYGLIEPVPIDNQHQGYQILGETLQWRPGAETKPSDSQSDGVDNAYFCTLYSTVASLLTETQRALFELEAREHTAQVPASEREKREENFREAKLRTLFCSPTMELGVDISTLNTVYLRNVPPTPANYAQRGGRAGRSGQPALILSYCAARSPHDQYFFQEPVRMVHGSVSPPTLDMANEELIASHIYAIWLNETQQILPPTVNGLLDMTDDDTLPILDEFTRQMDTAEVRERTTERGIRILRMLSGELQAARGVWLRADGSHQKALEEWLDHQVQGAFKLAWASAKPMARTLCRRPHTTAGRP